MAGVARGPAFKVRAGQTLAFAPRAQGQAPQPRETAPSLGFAPDHMVRLLGVRDGLATLNKPTGLHSESRGQGDSLEESLSSLGLPSGARLLTRLDYGTSGLCLAALDDHALHAFRAMEKTGRVRKGYLCLLDGDMRGPRLAAAGLDTKGGACVRVRAHVLAEPERRTELVPLAVVPPGLTLCAALITRGARHQIRAHAAKSGHPVHGDPLYGAPGETRDRAESCTSSAALQRFFLHCAGVVRPGASSFLPPPWLGLPDGLLDDAMEQLKALLDRDSPQ